MSTAKKTLYATIGVGEKAIETTRSLSSRLGELPTQLRRTGSIRELPKAAASLGTESTKRVRNLVQTSAKRTEELLGGARKQATSQFEDLAKRGEKLVVSIRRSQKTKTAAEKTKTAKTRVKSAAKATTTAVEATVDAVSNAVDRVEQHTDPAEALA